MLLSGQLLTFSSKGGPGATLGVASIFGEVGLVEDVVRDYSVSAVTTCRMWSIDRSLLDPRQKYLRPQIMDALEATPEWRELQVTVIEGMLASLPFFGTLVPSRRLGLAGLMTISWHDMSSVIFREGDHGEEAKWHMSATGVQPAPPALLEPSHLLDPIPPSDALLHCL